MITTSIIKSVLKTLFGLSDYASMYEVIDDDMRRKPAIRINKMKEYENGDNTYTITINWRLLDKFAEEK